MSADTVRTLIVDDVPRLRELVGDAISQAADFEVAGEAADGEEAIQQTRTLEPDLVLLDLSMPRMDGLEALSQIRREAPGIDVVVLSGFTSDRMAAIAEDHGALGYVEKGVGGEELVHRLRGFVADGRQPETQPPAEPPARQPDGHVHVVGLDGAAAKRVATALASARPSWRLSHGRPQPAGGTVPEQADVVVVAAGDCHGECEPTLSRLSSRHPETPLALAVPDVPQGCLRASIEAGATEVVDIEAVDEEGLATRIRWTTMVDERHRSRTRRLEMLAATMAHDLRGPLRALDRYADWVREGLEAGDHKRLETAAEGLQRNVERARRLIDSQLTYARLRTKPPAASVVDPRQALDQALLDLETAIAQTGATVDVGDLPRVVATPEELALLFRNLVSNAIKYQAEGETPTVAISGEAREEEVLLRVRDDGIGIEPDYHEEIFDPFTRLHAEEDYPGTGLGLAICREIVDRQGGEIEVDSDPGRGTTFTIRLPAPSAP